MIKKLALAILLAGSSMVSAQTIDPATGTVQVTNNVIDPTQWTNVIRMNSSQLGQVEGSGGGPVPAYNTDTNTIRFSYFPYTVSQIIAINTALSGQGISVNGFNYSWKIYNDLQNCCGTRGSLVGTVNFANNSGKILESYTYDYSLTNTGANFQTFSGTETFSSPYQLNSLGYVGVAWTGSDMNFWSGYYGPRVRDTSLTLNYTVKQSTTTAPTVTSTNTTTQTIVDASQPIVQETTPITSTTSTTTVAEVTTTPTVSSTTTNNTTPTTSTTSVASVNPVVTVANVTVAPTTQTTQQTSNTTSSSPSISMALSTIRNNEKREQAIVATAVASANETAQAAVQATEQTAMTVATTSSVASMASASTVQTVSSSTQTASTSTQSMIVATSNPAVAVSTASSQSIQGMMTPQLAPRVATTVQSTTNNDSITVSSANRTQTTNVQQSSFQPVVADSSISVLQGPTITEAPKPTVQSAITEMKLVQDNDLVVFTNNFLTNRTNPLTEIVENNTRPSNNTVEQKESVLNKTAQNNELAGGVNLERMAVQPIGYNAYLQLALRDVAFYAPKEIYRNQRVIDNQQAVRLLNFASDLKHQEMVNQQYGERK